MHFINKLFFSLCLVTSASGSYAADKPPNGERIEDIDKNRTSGPYKHEIFGFLKHVENAKIRSLGNQPDIGYVITQDTGFKNTFNWPEEIVKDGLFVKVKRFYYQSLYEEYMGYARQSRYVGYVEIFDWNNRDKQIHVKYDGDDNISLYFHVYPDEERFRFGLVKDFIKNPKVTPNKGPTAEESGVVF